MARLQSPTRTDCALRRVLATAPQCALAWHVAAEPCPSHARDASRPNDLDGNGPYVAEVFAALDANRRCVWESLGNLMPTIGQTQGHCEDDVRALTCINAIGTHQPDTSNLIPKMAPSTSGDKAPRVARLVHLPMPANGSESAGTSRLYRIFRRCSLVSASPSARRNLDRRLFTDSSRHARVRVRDRSPSATTS